MPRPKSGEAYEVLSVRVPHGLPARLTDHAKLHRKRVRDVIVEALQAYLDGTQVLPLEASADALVRAALGHITEAARVLGRVPTTRHIVAPLTEDPEWVFDSEKFYFGKLCPGGHDWHGTGKTLKRKQGNKCMACENERRAKQRQAKHQALESPVA